MSWNRLHNCRLPLAICGAVALVLTAVPLSATTARLASLGGGDYLEDDHNVQRWYGCLGDYPDQILIESGHFTLPEGWHDAAGHRVSGPGTGVHLALDPAGRWGTAAVFLNGHGDDVDPGSLAESGLDGTGTAMWSRRFGSLQATLIGRRGTSETGQAIAAGTSTPVRRAWDRARTELGAGLRWDMTDGGYLDLAGEWRRHREQVTVADSLLTVTGPSHTTGGSFGLRARAFLRLGPALALVPLLEYLRDDRAVAAPSPGLGLGVDGHLFRSGCGLNWYPDPDHFLVASLEYLRADADYLATPAGGPASIDAVRSWSSFSATLGFESRFDYWLTFRGSVRYEPVDFGTDTFPTADDFDTFMVNFGAAVQLAGYDLDLAVSDQEPQSVSGYYGHSLAGNPATWVTASLRLMF